MTARVNPSSSIADGALTLTITFPRSSPRLAAATSKLEGMALPLGTKPPEVALRLTDGAAALAGGVVALGGKVGMTTCYGLGREFPPTLTPTESGN
jgi:hypothetical protein